MIEQNLKMVKDSFPNPKIFGVLNFFFHRSMQNMGVTLELSGSSESEVTT